MENDTKVMVSVNRCLWSKNKVNIYHKRKLVRNWELVECRPALSYREAGDGWTKMPYYQCRAFFILLHADTR